MWPILLRLGPVTIYSFGVAIAVGVLCGSFLVWRQARRLGLSEEKVLDILFLTILLTLVFGRIGYVYSHWSLFAPDWSRILLVIKYPGLSFETSLVSSVLLSGLLTRNAGLSALLIWDIFSLAMTFALVLGFLGCFLDGCVAGAPSLPLFLALAWLAFWLGLMGLSQVLSRSPKLAEVSKRRGLFFLTYLIFQIISLLMLTLGTWDDLRTAVYLVVLLLLLVSFVVRYKELFTFLYDSISQRRSGANY